jgi:hypothetical protein
VSLQAAQKGIERPWSGHVAGAVAETMAECDGADRDRIEPPWHLWAVTGEAKIVYITDMPLMHVIDAIILPSRSSRAARLADPTIPLMA